MAESQPFRTTPDNTDRMPGGIPFIIGNEAAERFSFYGMKAILAIFLSKHLVDSAGAPAGMSDEEVRKTVSLFVAVTYATPFLGAILSDAYWGKYRTILWVSLLYCVGHGILALVDVPLGLEPFTIFGIGLATIAIGAGGIKPCVTAHVGDQFGPANKHHLSKVFAWFYLSINVGAVVASYFTPRLLDEYGPAWAFGIPGLFMALATFCFWLGRHRYIHIPPGGNAFIQEALSPVGLGAIGRLLPLFLFISVFWSLFDQTASEWVLQADKLDLTLFGAGESAVALLPAQTQLINPLFILLLVPLFNYVLYPIVDRIVRVTTMRKIGFGMFLTALSFLLGAWVESKITAGQTPTVWWQVLMYLLLTSGEVMLSISAYELAYTQAPRNIKSFVMACYLLSITAGNLLTYLVNVLIVSEEGTSLLPGASYYLFFAALMGITTVAFACWSPFFREKTYLQGEAD